MKLRYFRKIVSLVFAVFLLLLVFSPNIQADITVQAASGSTTVYITDYGEKYHTSTCQYLYESRHSISLSSAVERGYKPCSVCNPPRLSSGGNTTPTPSNPSYQGGGSTRDDERWIPIFWVFIFGGIAIWLIVKLIRDERAEKRRLLEEQEDEEKDDYNE